MEAPLADRTPGGGSHTGLPLDVERELVRRMQAQDPDAFGAIYESYLPRLYRYCLVRLRNPIEAEDAAEDIFVRVLSSIDRFTWRPMGASRSPFAAWIFRIAHNHLVSIYRRAAVRPGLDPLSETIADEQRGPEELAERRSEIDEAFEAVALLPEAQRDVVLLRFGSGLSVAETAAALNKTQGNVKVLQHKGVRRLREILGDEGRVTRRGRSVKAGRA